MAKSVSHPHIYEYIDDRLRAAYLYFGNPQTKGGALLTLDDVGQLRRKLHENLKHMHELSQNSTSSPGLKSAEVDLISRDRHREIKSNISQKKCIAPSVSGNFEDFADRIGKSVLDSALSTVCNRFHPATPEKSDEENEDILEACMSSSLVEDSVESSENVDELRIAKSDSEHSEGEDSVDCQDSEESEESDDLCDQELETKEAAEADTDLDSSLAQTKCNGGIEGLYDESLVHGLREDDFNYKFDADVLYDGKVCPKTQIKCIILDFKRRI